MLVGLPMGCQRPRLEVEVRDVEFLTCQSADEVLGEIRS